MKTNTIDAARRSQTGQSRCTIREFDDDHLVQELKTADVMNSESPTGVERYQPCGFTSVPMKQKQDQQPGGSQGSQGGQGSDGGGQGGGNSPAGNWSKNQPKGESAEGMMTYMNGSRSHPMCGQVDDRRVRPYGQQPGESQHYSADGSGQTVYHRVHGDSNDGLYLVTLDDQGGGTRADGSAQQQQSRKISIRHANKKKQRRQKQQQGQRDASSGGGQQSSGLPDDSKSGYKHEGDSVNTEVELDKSKINFNDGAGNAGYYDNGQKDWMYFSGDHSKSMRATNDHTHIKHGGAHVWVQGVPYKSMPFVVKPDPCT
jgi:hypothetical protein